MNQLACVPVRRPYCDGSGHRLGIACRFCAPTRLELHEASCGGMRDWWHVLSGEHIRIARWDLREATFLSDRAWERYRVVRARVDALTDGSNTRNVEEK